jgi:hypothetical protein
MSAMRKPLDSEQLTRAHVYPFVAFMVFMLVLMVLGYSIEWKHPDAPWWRQQPSQMVYPLQTLVATRDTLADILAGTNYTGIIRGGYTSGNRFGLTMPRLQPIERGDSERGQLMAEALQLRVLPPATQDSNTRDNDYVLSFS